MSGSQQSASMAGSPAAEAPQPVKIGEIRNHHLDSRIWNDFKFRKGDIVYVTYPKSGTTWMRQIIRTLLPDVPDDGSVERVSPWVELRPLEREPMMAALEACTHRRFLKSHLAAENLVISPLAKYIFVARDGRDVVWSLYNHHSNFLDTFFDFINSGDLVGPRMLPVDKDVVSYFAEWLERDGYPLWSFWSCISSWWKIRDHPNVHLVHFENLKRDLKAQVVGIKDFLEIDVDEDRVNLAVVNSSFDYMKRNSRDVAEFGELYFKGGADIMINKGTNRRWKDILPRELSDRYERMAEEKLGKECAYWLKTGKTLSCESTSL